MKIIEKKSLVDRKKDFNNFLEEHYPTICEKTLWYLHSNLNRGDIKGAHELVDRIFTIQRLEKLESEVA